MPDASGGVAFRRQFWSIILHGALRYPWSWLSASGSAVAVWIPPGGAERTAQGDDELTMLLASMPPQAAERTRSVLDALERQHPTLSDGDQEPAYLSLLAVHPTQQGKGEGSALLKRTLERIDG
jgi:GNAT superfamily N-acetyltransferase